MSKRGIRLTNPLNITITNVCHHSKMALQFIHPVAQAQNLRLIFFCPQIQSISKVPLTTPPPCISKWSTPHFIVVILGQTTILSLLDCCRSLLTRLPAFLPLFSPLLPCPFSTWIAECYYKYKIRFCPCLFPQNKI